MAPKLITVDRQGKRVYKWEQSWGQFTEQTLSRDGVREWAKWAYRKFGFLRVPRIIFDDKSFSEYKPDGDFLSFTHSHRNIGIVLHEVSHAITTRMYGVTVEDHGPEFMGVYLYLLEASGEFPKHAMTDSAKRAKLRIDGSQGPGLAKLARINQKQ